MIFLSLFGHEIIHIAVQTRIHTHIRGWTPVENPLIKLSVSLIS